MRPKVTRENYHDADKGVTHRTSAGIFQLTGCAENVGPYTLIASSHLPNMRGIGQKRVSSLVRARLKAKTGQDGPAKNMTTRTCSR